MTFDCVNAALDECRNLVHPHDYPDSGSALEMRMQTIERELSEIKDVLDFIRNTIVKADTTITTVAEQVMPTVNSLLESPMVKMLGLKK